MAFAVLGGWVGSRRRVFVRACSSNGEFPISERVKTFLGKVPGGRASVGLQRAEDKWKEMREGKGLVTSGKEVVFRCNGDFQADGDVYDCVICGGTLGIFVAAALTKKGYRVAVLEQGVLQGRDQEWNVSRSELQELVKLGLIDETRLEASILSSFNPMRCGFGSDPSRRLEINVRDVLNLGVSPKMLIDEVKQTFLAGGGDLLEFTRFEKAEVFDGGVAIHAKAMANTTKGSQGAGGAGWFMDGTSDHGSRKLYCRLLIDAMGHFSPIAAQARGFAEPDGICLVVGSCAQNFRPTERDGAGDLIFSFTDVENGMQYFWEQFPAAGGGRTSYMFLYTSKESKMPSLSEMYDDYIRLLPEYLGTPIGELEPLRVFFGFFPSFKKHSPLRSRFDRVFHIGDSSGLQSPLSFGGFGALLRHLPRLDEALGEALKSDERLTASNLRLLSPYQPNLSVTWLFQKAMTASRMTETQPAIISQTMSNMFAVMSRREKRVMYSFLRDVVQFRALLVSIVGMVASNPVDSVKVLAHVGFLNILEWLFHFVALGYTDALQFLATKSARVFLTTKDPFLRYAFKRRLEGWTYGSGRDLRIEDGDVA